jgi:hypothetical protein
MGMKTGQGSIWCKDRQTASTDGLTRPSPRQNAGCVMLFARSSYVPTVFGISRPIPIDRYLAPGPAMNLPWPGSTTIRPSSTARTPRR